MSDSKWCKDGEVGSLVGRQKKAETERPSWQKDKNKEKGEEEKGVDALNNWSPEFPELTPRHIHPEFMRWIQNSSLLCKELPERKKRVIVIIPSIKIVIGS